MAADGSHDYSSDLATASASMTGEEEINDLTVGSSQGAGGSRISWGSSHRTGRETMCRDTGGDVGFRDANREVGSSSNEGRSSLFPSQLNTGVLGVTGESSSYRRLGKNEETLVDVHQPHPHRSLNMWSEVKRHTQSSPPPSPSHSPQSNGGWRLLKGDHSGPRGAPSRREQPDNSGSNEPAQIGEIISVVSPASEKFASACASLLVGVPAGMPIHYGPGMEAELARQAVRRAYPDLGSALATEAINEGMEIRVNPDRSFAEAHEMIPGGATAEVEAFELELERSSEPPRGVRAGRQKFRGVEKLHHKRARFIALSARRHHSSVPSRSSSPSSSSSSRPSSPSGWEQGGQPPPSEGPFHLLPQDWRDPMEMDYTEGEDGDDGRNHMLAAMEDDEVRMDLTDDLLHKIFSFLDDTSLCQAAMVCKQWRVASAHEDFWKSLNFEERSVSHEQVGRLCVRYPKATQLNLRGVSCVDEVLVRDAMRSLRNLEMLTLGRGLLSDGFFYALAAECAALQNLSITEAVLGSGGAQEIQLRHDSLRSLQIQKCRVLRIAIRCPQLDHLSLKRTGTASAILHCPRLITLDVSSCHKLSDASVRAAATACPLLATLDMSNCTYVSDETLREISVACTNLRTLDASYCPNISLEGVRMPMLMDLRLISCEGIISSSMAALANCAMLEVLQMDFCWLLTAVTLDLPRLRQISLSNIRKFVELTLRSPALEKLNLTNCPSLNRVDITSSSLQSLALRQQLGLSSMALQCPWLREVDLTECESLTNAVCDVFSDGGGCPKLNTLILDSCEGLTEVKLSSSSLQSLSLAGCRNISSLTLACPVLQHLHLDGCDHLTAASFSPVGLQSLNLGICPHLVKLEVEASQMTSLDLRGCGVLNQATIRCPSLLSLDASYCSQLGDDCLTATTYACPAIQSLVLASCPSVGPAGLLALKRLRDLTMLDLSYTFLTDLSPIFEACPRLKVLRLSACKYLGDTALDALHGGKVLPELRELDLSYGSLGHSAIERVMALCPHLSRVSLNGCAHVTDLLWACLSAPPVVGVGSRSGSSIEDTGMEDALSPNGTSDIHVRGSEQPMDLGVSKEIRIEHATISGVDETDEVASEIESSDLESSVNLLTNVSDSSLLGSCPEPVTIISTELEIVEPTVSIDAETGLVRALQNLSCVGCPHIKRVFLPRFAACFHLSSLNLSLSINIREVSLSCMNLTSLNLSNCAGLVLLQLECPRLMSLCLQACGIEAEMLELAIQGCGLLETLDVRNCSKVSPAALAQMRTVCPGLKRLYTTMLT